MNTNYKRFFILLAIALASFQIAIADRQTVSLDGEWSFLDPEADSAVTVSVPHSWDYYRSAYNLSANIKTCSYERTIDVSKYQDKRMILCFEGVNKTAVVKVDGAEVGKHIGGFCTFCIDITDAAKGKTSVTLTVDVTNIDFNTMPVNSDFTHFAGIYRDVKLIVVEPELSLSKLDYGSNGVYFSTNVNATSRAAAITPSVAIDYNLDSSKEVSIKNKVFDAQGKCIATQSQTFLLEGLAKAQIKSLDPITLTDITLWNGTKNPYLYTIETSVMIGEKILDHISTKVGLRTYEVKDGIFFLNGEEYKLRGVGMHQERNASTNVSTDEERESDINTVLEMGANAIRTCHYPFNQQFYDLCDEKGIVCWSEIPFYLIMLDTDEFKDNCTKSVKEMVKQAYNHPSIIVWGLENEVNVYTAYQAYYPTQATTEQLGSFVKELAQTVKDIDASRLVGEAEADNMDYAKETSEWTTKESGINVVGFNVYTGWYSDVNGATQANKKDYIETPFKNKMSQYQSFFNSSSDNNVSYVMSEYGAGANITQHADMNENFLWGGTDATKGYTTSGTFHPEEYQSYVHESMIMALYGDSTNNIEPVPNIWCAFAWSMFDFSCYRNEGSTTRLNTKGLITADRQTKKDSYYLYKANWNKTDYFTHICSSRYTERSSNTMDIKVYSNCESVNLTVNGIDIGSGTMIQDGVFVWKNVTLKEKDNTVFATGLNGSSAVCSDKCDSWIVASPTVVNTIKTGNTFVDSEYNAIGQRVNRNARGLVIRSGKKYIAK